MRYIKITQFFLMVLGISASALALSVENVEERFNELDLNRDGYIDQSEATQDPMLRKHWNDVDKNDNERLNFKEFKAYEKVPREPFPAR